MSRWLVLAVNGVFGALQSMSVRSLLGISIGFQRLVGSGWSEVRFVAMLVRPGMLSQVYIFGFRARIVGAVTFVQ